MYDHTMARVNEDTIEKILESMANDLKFLAELRDIAKRKHEIWEEDTVRFGLTWRDDALAREYQELEKRIWEIKQKLFGDYAMEV